ncbi:MAG: class I SAM-dependent methyltransferase [Oscillospiraceae bacterium]|nr:class I SAM-dependent methyltransferase [Oscillospiraceae bacterium]
MDYLQIEKGVREIYNSMGERYIEKARELWREKDELSAFLDMLNGDSVLDIGCGTGEVLSYCAGRGLRVSGIDISERMLEIAGKAVPEAGLSVLSVYELSKLRESYDGIIASYILVHIPKDKVGGVVKDIYSLLNPGGKLFLVFTTARETNEYMFNYTADEVTELLEDSDFRVIKAVAEANGDLDTGIAVAER